MRAVWILLICLGTMVSAVAAPGRITKVLQHLEDMQGRIAVSPSLYERDAYQAQLRAQPATVRALRFDVGWKARVAKTKPLKLQIEVMGENNPPGKPTVFEQEVFNRGIFRNWSSVRVNKAAYEALGRVISWRATIWDGDALIAEQKSFLW